MPISPISRIKTIAHKLGTTEDIVTIYSTSLVVGTDYFPGYNIINFNAFIKNLKAFANVASLTKAPLPDFLPTDTSTQKTMKVLDIEWQSPRKQLNLYISANNSGVWHQVGSLSMINPYGYPFRIYNLMDLFTDNLAVELGENSRIGVQVQDVGFGLLTAQDSVTIHGSYTEEMFVQTEEKQTINNYSFVLPNEDRDVTNNYTFEIRNVVTGGSSTPPPTNGGTTPTVDKSFSNTSTVSNTSVVSN